MNATFNENTANLTLGAKLVAYPYSRANDSGSSSYGHGGEISIGDSVQGTIRFTFKGVLDSYHSEVLDMNATMTKWLWTVGFGNNSMNAGYNSGGQGRPGIGVRAFVLLLSVSTALL